MSVELQINRKAYFNSDRVQPNKIVPDADIYKTC